MAGFSVGDREIVADKINKLTEEFGSKCPPIYLLFGDLSESNMSDLYHHPKVKAMISFTKGEGYGRPLAEFATTGKPILVSNWSGLVDFLPKDNTIYLEGQLTPVHASAQNQFLLKESKWFTVDYSKAAQSILDLHKNYNKHLKKSAGLKTNIVNNFSLSKMHEVMGRVFNKYVQIKQKIELKLPEIKKL
jgi:glycosyltransferase involved in cell wall biosynthesis